MESFYTKLALMGAKVSVLGLIMSFPYYLSSAMVRFPLIYIFAYFQFDHFPKSPIDFESSIVKKFLERFDQQQKKLKIGFPIVYSNLARKGLGFFSMPER